MKNPARKIVFVLSLIVILLAAWQIIATTETQKISGNIVDVVKKEIYPGTLVIKDGRIIDIIKSNKEFDTFIIPGLIDAHVHIESSMLPPAEFARLAVVHGTVATVSDPHEIANVLGLPGIEYMLEKAKRVPFKFYFGASSCVPATGFETAGAKIDAQAVDKLLQREEIKYMSEMMNYPGVINGDPEVMAKLAIAKNNNKPIDGHAPGLLGEELKKYAQAGITTDHETYEYEEGLQEINLGIKLIIREGSAAKNFNELHPLLGQFPQSCMFCSDDKHPDDLVKGHINEIVKRAISLGYDKIDVLRCASYNPVKHYGLEVGLLQKGDFADFVVVNNFKDFNILKTYVNGELVAQNGRSFIKRQPAGIKNNFSIRDKKAEDFLLKDEGGLVNIIEAVDGKLITNWLTAPPKIAAGYAVSDPQNDILKIAVVNRYSEAPIALGFVKNFGLKKGAVASSFAHDSHNIVAVGVSDEDLARAVNLVIRNRGGLALVFDNQEEFLNLPLAGLMSVEDGYTVAHKYSQMTAKVKELGSTLRAPYMTLSFMALLVIPELKLSDKGLFDGKKFKFVNVFVDAGSIKSEIPDKVE